MDLCSNCGCRLPGEGDVIHDWPPNKPSWWDAPEWAQYIASDKNGNWWWYENRPTAEGMCCYWRNNHNRVKPNAARLSLAAAQPCSGHNEFYTHWMHTREKRPDEIPPQKNKRSYP